ncbi:MAG: type II secretion system F family protein [Mycetocola sp.]
MVGTVAGVINQLGPSERQVGLRLRRAGVTVSADQYRRRLAVAVLTGVAAGCVVAAAAWATGRGVSVLVLPVLGGVVGGMLPEFRLRQKISQRRAQIEQEIPVVLELISLSLMAGESVRNSVGRIAGQSSGAVGRALSVAMGATETGVPLATALASASLGADVPAFSRMTEHICAALERGAPVAEVLRDQAGDARELSRRRLLEEAGRREIMMMIPLVFVILPLSVIFAVFPGVFVINSGLL